MKKTSLGLLAFAAPILLAMTWFTLSALHTGRIRMGDGVTPFSEVFTREDQPKDYWRSVGCFIAVTSFCWFGVGFHIFREYRRSKEENANRDETVGRPRRPQPKT